LVEYWYLGQAKSKLNATAQPLIERFKKYKVEPSSIVLREMPHGGAAALRKEKSFQIRHG
jgi:hypothetical protein